MATAGVSAAIIAGGGGTRLGGRVKALVEVDGQCILDRQLAVLRELTGDIVIAANDAEAFSRWALPVVPDAHSGAGPLAGIAAALQWSPRTRVLCVASDMPYLSAPLLRHIVTCAPECDIVVPRANGLVQPLCGVYSRNCVRVIEDRLFAGQRSAQGLVRDEGTGLNVRILEESEIRTFDPSLRSFFNVNTPSDLFD